MSRFEEIHGLTTRLKGPRWPPTTSVKTQILAREMRHNEIWEQQVMANEILALQLCI